MQCFASCNLPPNADELYLFAIKRLMQELGRKKEETETTTQ